MYHCFKKMCHVLLTNECWPFGGKNCQPKLMLTIYNSISVYCFLCVRRLETEEIQMLQNFATFRPDLSGDTCPQCSSVKRNRNVLGCFSRECIPHKPAILSSLLELKVPGVYWSKYGTPQFPKGILEKSRNNISPFDFQRKRKLPDFWAEKKAPDVLWTLV